MTKSSPQRAGGLSLLLSLALVAILAYLWQPAEETFVGLQRVARSTHVEMMGDKGKKKAGGGDKPKADKAAPAKKGGKEAPAAPAKAAPAKKKK
jgi:hypothetical protein